MAEPVPQIRLRDHWPMASQINFYSEIVISVIRISDITNVIRINVDFACHTGLARPAALYVNLPVPRVFDYLPCRHGDWCLQWPKLLNILCYMCEYFREIFLLVFLGFLAEPQVIIVVLCWKNPRQNV